MHPVYRRALAAAALIPLTAGALSVAPPALANPGGTGLVISEVYGGGGNAGAPLNADFIEIYNPTTGPISLAGKSLQYRSAAGTGTSGNVFSLPAVDVPAGKTFLVKGASGATGAALPTPDATSTLNLSGTGGQVFLANSSSGIDPGTGAIANANVIDFVGWGSSTTSFETARAAATNNTTSVSRTSTGADTDNNAADFTVTNPPTPTNCDCDAPPPAGGDKTIAEIQGTGPASPLIGATVTTEGVVTAIYPTGGLNGFYLQTGGPDATPGASDAVFVYGPSFDESTLSLGQGVEVTGEVSEFSNLTEVTASTVTPAAGLAPVTPGATIPGTTCALPGTDCLTGAALDAAREEHEGELYLPTGAYTVTDSYDGSAFPSTSSSNFGEIGLAAESDVALKNLTEVVDAQDTAGIAARKAYNDAHRMILDDGSSTNYTTTTGSPVPWLTLDHTVRLGASVTFPAPVVLDFRFGWKLQPQTTVVGVPNAAQPQIEQDRPAAPAEVGGDLKLATFNVLNYFTTFGSTYTGGACTSYKDRAGVPVTVNSCPGNGPRGAWDQVNFERQQAKIVRAINTLDADIVSLEELENSLLVDGVDRDEAIGALVAALNADAGSTRWAFPPSPAAVPEGEDVIRNGFIYNPDAVSTVGASQILIGSAAFDNAREPLAQAFKRAGAADADAFAVIVNHFKSKGSGVDDGTGQGNSNPDRVAQAEALVTFADEFAASRGTEKVFLTGDFNSYTMEDPVQALVAAGYTNLESTDDPQEESYGFDGAAGSLDHVFANAAALGDVTGVDIWEINANEPVYYEYSRFNYNVTNLYAPNQYRASDHNPEIVGINAAAGPVDPITPAINATINPGKIKKKKDTATIKVTVSGDPTPTGKVKLKLDGIKIGVATLVNGKAEFEVGPYRQPGIYKFKVRYAGNDIYTKATATVQLEVTNGNPHN